MQGAATSFQILLLQLVPPASVTRSPKAMLAELMEERVLVEAEEFEMEMVRPA